MARWLQLTRHVYAADLPHQAVVSSIMLPFSTNTTSLPRSKVASVTGSILTKRLNSFPFSFYIQTKPRLQRGGSSASLHNSLMRNSIFQLMIHTLDPLAEGIPIISSSVAFSFFSLAKKGCLLYKLLSQFSFFLFFALHLQCYVQFH